MTDPTIRVTVSERKTPSDEHLRQIGRVVVAWAALEDDLHGLLQKMLQTNDEIATIITRTLWGHRFVIETIGKIAPVVFDGESGPRTYLARELMKNIEGMVEERGWIAHSTWWQRIGAREPDRSRMKRGVRGVRKTPDVTVESLKNLADRMSEAGRSVRDLTLRDYRSGAA